MTKVHVSRGGEYDISKSNFKNYLSILKIHSSDIDIIYDLKSKNLLQRKKIITFFSNIFFTIPKILVTMLTILSHME